MRYVVLNRVEAGTTEQVVNGDEFRIWLTAVQNSTAFEGNSDAIWAEILSVLVDKEFGVERQTSNQNLSAYARYLVPGLIEMLDLEDRIPTDLTTTGKLIMLF